MRAVDRYPETLAILTIQHSVSETEAGPVNRHRNSVGMPPSTDEEEEGEDDELSMESEPDDEV